jgi:hypothetical protein
LADLFIYSRSDLSRQARRRIPDAPPQQVLAPIAAGPKRAAPRSPGGNASADVELDPVM